MMKSAGLRLIVPFAAEGKAERGFVSWSAQAKGLLFCHLFIIVAVNSRRAAPVAFA
jgi:hypothetical protein